MLDYREFEDGQQIQGTRYRVVRRMGAGGMGTVYEVEHVELGKRFVLKALLRELSRREDLVQRLRNEWRALGRLEHPNIVTVTDAGSTASGVPFFVMERLEGETLAERMRRVRRFGVAEALSITAAILDGISAAHEIGVVHRDIKPPNIILVGGDRPKILDFGVAKIADDPGVVTARGVAVGTPRYMSPEQARGESVDGRADIYSSGLLLFEMVAGVGPFDDARDSNELILAHIARVAPPLSSFAIGVIAELDAAVASMLQKNHHRRPATAREARDQLRAVLAKMNEAASRAPRALPEARPRAVAPASASGGIRAANTARPEARPTLGTKTSFSAPPFSFAPSEYQATAVSLLGNQATEPAPGVDDAVPASGTSASVGAVVRNLGATGATIADPLSGALPSNRSGAPALRPAVVKTEILTTIPSPSPNETHTQLPRPDKPRSVTPPPITPNQVPVAAPSRLVSVLLAIGIAAVVLGVGGLGFDLLPHRARAPAAQASVAGAAVAALEPSTKGLASGRETRAPVERPAEAAAPSPSPEPESAARKPTTLGRGGESGRPKRATPKKATSTSVEAQRPETQSATVPAKDATPAKDPSLKPTAVAVPAGPASTSHPAEGALPRSGL